MAKLKKGEMTETPVKTQFGYHIIKLEDTREAQFPAFEEVKAQLKQRMGQAKLQGVPRPAAQGCQDGLQVLARRSVSLWLRPSHRRLAPACKAPLVGAFFMGA